MHGDSSSKELTTMPMLEAVYARNFRIHDLCLQSAPDSSLGPPGIEENQTGLMGVRADVLEELPEECRVAFESARRREGRWKSRWLTESTDGMRAKFTGSVNWTG